MPPAPWILCWPMYVRPAHFDLLCADRWTQSAASQAILMPCSGQLISSTSTNSFSYSSLETLPQLVSSLDSNLSSCRSNTHSVSSSLKTRILCTNLCTNLYESNCQCVKSSEIEPLRVGVDAVDGAPVIPTLFPHYTGRIVTQRINELQNNRSIG